MATPGSIERTRRNRAIFDELCALLQARGVDTSNSLSTRLGNHLQIDSLPADVLVEVTMLLTGAGAAVEVNGPSVVHFRIGRGQEACHAYLTAELPAVRDDEALAVASAVLGLERLVTAGEVDAAVAQFGAVATGLLLAGRAQEAYVGVAEQALLARTNSVFGTAVLYDPRALVLATLLDDAAAVARSSDRQLPGHAIVAALRKQPGLVETALLLDLASGQRSVEAAASVRVPVRRAAADTAVPARS